MGSGPSPSHHMPNKLNDVKTANWRHPNIQLFHIEQFSNSHSPGRHKFMEIETKAKVSNLI